MNDPETSLRTRLARLEGSVAVGTVPRMSALRRDGWRGRRFAVPLLIGAGMLLFGSGAVVGSRVLAPNEAIGREGFSNVGQPFHCVGLERMTPPEADAAIRARGYTVTWQIEDQAARSSRLDAHPPATGFVIGGFVKDMHAHVVLETGTAAEPIPPQQC
ncbi:MAG: hypothetical protein M3395_10235 [Chloroflexota bacterium]|nr:hypothetical protein [Chloroflexota bacterium]